MRRLLLTHCISTQSFISHPEKLAQCSLPWLRCSDNNESILHICNTASPNRASLSAPEKLIQSNTGPLGDMSFAMSEVRTLTGADDKHFNCAGVIEAAAALAGGRKGGRRDPLPFSTGNAERSILKDNATAFMRFWAVVREMDLLLWFCSFSPNEVRETTCHCSRLVSLWIADVMS